MGEAPGLLLAGEALEWRGHVSPTPDIPAHMHHRGTEPTKRDHSGSGALMRPTGRRTFSSDGPVRPSH